MRPDILSRASGGSARHFGIDDPRATAFTVIEREATSRASDFVNPTRPPWRAVVGLSGVPHQAHHREMLTMRP